ncbi:hypothetical protein BU16DRAFT_620230 [Lophium mytilinum]|uniref:Nuclear pore complex protein An-Nup82 n=1 Tax=Lophium mytilinum TaxID=390894 RepID=A0A6A6QLJ5_9PEZI|nr:hypothetical protein BU16DRAFT_620230 [Lophium mytilinum]
MPKVISYTPPWLSRPSPGFDLFAPKASSKATNGHKAAQEYSGTNKTIAKRGTEVFVAVGNEIRWSDLVLLQEKSEEQANRLGHSRSRPGRSAAQDEVLHRVLRVGVHGAIKQLVISPEGEFMAIATTHTIHIAVLPNSSHLGTEDTSPLKLKTFQLGPTAHVLEQSPIASVLWHPLGYRGRCLVTITTDAVVRLWELNRTNRYSFSEPTVAVDLRKLIDATSTEDDLSVSGYAHSKGFSPDAYEWEIASACFGGSLEQEGINGWSPMTLWVAMKEGDVYALCPLLPSKWQVTKSPGTSTILQHLTTAIESQNAYTEESSTKEQRISQAQFSWLLDILDQEPVVEKDHLDDVTEIYSRPESTPIFPKLQGPLQLTPDLDDSKDFEISDILVFGLSNLDSVDEDGSPEGLSASVVCLLSSNCDVHMCLDLEGVEGQWLPAREDSETALEEGDEDHTLLVVETVHLLPRSSQGRPLSSHPTFTLDDSTDFAFFVTDESGVFHLSMLSWVPDLERELSGAQIEGAEFRLNGFLNLAQSAAEKIFPLSEKEHQDATHEIASCVAYDVADLGHFVLTAVHGQPLAATLDSRGISQPFRDAASEELDIPDLPLRPTYQPPAVFYHHTKLTSFMDEKVPARYKSSLTQEVRLSAATLEIMTNAHRILSHETNQLGLAASDLFSRCERLKLEFKAQILRAAQLADQIDKTTGADEDTFEDDASEDRAVGKTQIDDRLKEVKARQAALVSQHDRIRAKLAQTNPRKLTEKEQMWMEEVEKMSQAINKQQQQDDSDKPSTLARVEEVRRIKEQVIKEAKDTDTSQADAGLNGNGHVLVSSDFRKQKVETIHKMLEKEKAMLDSAQDRVEKMAAIV